MSVIANVVINDSVPLPHTLLPVKVSPSAEYRENLASLPVSGQTELKVSLTNKKNLYKVRITLDMPVMEEASGANAEGYTAAPKIAHMVRVDAVFFAHGRSTQLQRTDLLTLFQNALSNLQVQETFTLLNKPL